MTRRFEVVSRISHVPFDYTQGRLKTYRRGIFDFLDSVFCILYSVFKLRAAYCIRDKVIQTGRMAQLRRPAVRRPQGNAASSLFLRLHHHG